MIKIKFIVLLINLSLCTSIAMSQTAWKQYNGPYSGNVFSFTSKGDTLFAGTDLSGIFYSTDLGNTWKITGMEYGNNGCMVYVDNFLIDGSNDYPFISTDGGMHWQQSPSIGGAFRCLLKYNNTAYAGTSEGVFIFNKSNTTWTNVSNGIGSEDTAGSRDIKSMMSIDSILLCGTNQNGAYLSTDNGSNWTHIPKSSGLLLDNISHLLNYNGILIASSWLGNESIYQSTDTAKTWSALPNNSVLVNSMVVFNDTLIESTWPGGVYKFDPGNNQWLPMSSESFYRMYVWDCLLLASNEFGLYRWNSDSSSFILSNTGINTARVIDLALFNNKLYASTTTGVFYTEDDGESWQYVPQSKGNTCYTVEECDTNLYIGTSNGIYATSLNTEQWRRCDSSFNHCFMDIKSTDSTIYIATADIGAFKSSDAGNSWLPIDSGFGQIPHLAADMGIILAGTSDGLYKLSDSLSNWSSAGIENQDVGMVNIIGNDIFVSARDGSNPPVLYRSSDTCQTWESLGIESLNTNSTVYDIFRRGDNLYASGNWTIFYTANEGISWDNWTEQGMPTMYIKRVIQSDSCLYAATYGKSIYKRNYLDSTDCNFNDYTIVDDSIITDVPPDTPPDSFQQNVRLSYGASMEVTCQDSTSKGYMSDGDIVRIIAEDGISKKSYIISILLTPILDVIRYPAIEIYPNPTTYELTIDFVSTDQYFLYLFDLFGTRRLSTRLDSGSKTVDLTSVDSGVYVFTIVDSKGDVIKTDKLIILK